MSSRILSNINLKAFFSLGEDGWNTDIDQNFLRLSALVQAGVLSTTSTLPSGQQNDVFLLDENELTNPNSIAIFDNNQWTFIRPNEGWFLFDRAANIYKYYNGSVWANLPLNDPKIISLANLDNTTGILYQNSPDTISKLSIGVDNDSDILNKQLGDLRFSPIDHVHTDDRVLSFNTRVGNVELSSNDITNALTYVPQASDAKLDGLSLLDGSSGILEKIGENEFSIRGIGVSSDSDLLTRGDGDTRFINVSEQSTIDSKQDNNTTLDELIALDGEGIIELTENGLSIRGIGNENGNNLITRFDADNRYPFSSVLVSSAGANLIGTNDGFTVQGFVDSFIENANSTADIEDATSNVNVANKYIGRMVYNTTTGKPVWATGVDPISPWNDATGIAEHTPS